MKDELERLRKEAAVALDLWHKTMDDRETAMRAAKKQALAEIEKRFEEPAEELSLRRAAAAAQRAREDEEIRLALAGVDAPWPVGTLLEHWEEDTWNRGKAVVTEEGMLEVMTRETVLPDNTADYSVPRLGVYIIRILKADGKPSKRIAKDFFRWRSQSDKMGPKKSPAGEILV